MSFTPKPTSTLASVATSFNKSAKAKKNENQSGISMLKPVVLYRLGEAYINEFGEEPIIYSIPIIGKINSHTNQPIANGLKTFAEENPNATPIDCLLKLYNVLNKLKRPGALMHKIVDILNATLGCNIRSMQIYGRHVEPKKPKVILSDFLKVHNSAFPDHKVSLNKRKKEPKPCFLKTHEMKEPTPQITNDML